MRVATDFLFSTCVASLTQSLSWLSCLSGAPFWVHHVSIDDLLTHSAVIIDVTRTFTFNIRLSEDLLVAGRSLLRCDRRKMTEVR